MKVRYRRLRRPRHREAGMPVTNTQVASYGLEVFSAGDSMAAVVTLFGQTGDTVAFVRFYPEGTPMKPNEYRADLGYPLISYPFASWAATVDLLRNESPVYFTWF